MNSPEKLHARIAPEGNYLVITPPNDLKDKAKPGRNTPSPEAAIASAEQALEDLSENFEQWLKEELDKLFAAWDQVEIHGMAAPHGEKLFLAGHDLKGQAETFGHPLIGAYCASMCKMFDHVASYDLIPLHAIQSHIQAVKAAYRDNIKDTENATANAVYDKLLEMTTEFCGHHNELRLDKAQKANDQFATEPSPNLEELAAASGAVIVGMVQYGQTE